ncbi:MAG: cation:proton antiporter [Candidatus Geothermarchaeales archaeon]
MMSELLVFLILSIIILSGFAGHLFFERTGIPSFLFLILMGVIMGPVLHIVDRSSFLPVLGVFGSFTLIMVTFYSGLNLDIKNIISQSGRTLLQSTLFIVVSISLIGMAGHTIFGWDLIQALILGSMTGGEITAAVVVPLAFSLGFSDDVKSLLTLESAISTVYSVVFFFAFLQQWQLGNIDLSIAAASIMTNFSVGIVFGIIFSLVFLRILHHYRGKSYTYVLTIGMVIAIYTMVELLNGNGAFGVLMLGLFLSNERILSRFFGVDMDIRVIFPSLNHFQSEVSFLLETFFFVFLGSVFTIEPSSILTNLLYSAVFLSILLTVRYMAVFIATYNSPLAKNRFDITYMCAQGLVPATLSILLLNYNVPLKDVFLSIITYIIILTNVVTAVGVWHSSRRRRLRERRMRAEESIRELLQRL